MRRLPWILFSLWLLQFAATAQFLLVVPILPQIGRALDIPPDLEGTLITAYGLPSALCALIAGPISDRVGRRRVLLTGTAGLAVALLLHPLATSYASFAAVRALGGVAWGVSSGAIFAYIGDLVPYDRRGRATGWVLSGTAVGQVAGIPLGTLAADRMGVAAPFVGFGALLVLDLGLLLLILVDPPVRLAEPLRLSDALRAYGALAVRRDAAASAAVYLFMFFGIASWITYMPTWLQIEHGATTEQIATMYAVGGTAAIVGNPLAGRVSDRIGRRGIILASCAGLLALQLTSGFVLYRVEVAYAIFFGAMICASMRMSPLQSLVTELVAADRRGTLLGLTGATGSFGFALGSALSGPVYHRAGFVACSGVAALSVAVVIALVAGVLPEPPLRGATEAG